MQVLCALLSVARRLVALPLLSGQLKSSVLELFVLIWSREADVKLV